MNSSIDIHIGRQIRQLRKTRKISQASLGQAINVSFQQIQKYEKGINKISAGKLFEIASVLDTEINYFFDGFIPQNTQNELHEDQAEFIYSEESNNNLSKLWPLIINKIHGTEAEKNLLKFLQSVILINAQ